VGRKQKAFFDKFANHQATSVGADGKDIESVTMRLKTDEAVMRAVNMLGVKMIPALGPIFSALVPLKLETIYGGTSRR